MKEYRLTFIDCDNVSYLGQRRTLKFYGSSVDGVKKHFKRWYPKSILEDIQELNIVRQ